MERSTMQNHPEQFMLQRHKSFEMSDQMSDQIQNGCQMNLLTMKNGVCILWRKFRESQAKTHKKERNS